ncbi:hypothetical protein BRC77_09770 [Halobacteriales archaeon QH_8_64_26]|jgi:hypothetical protein|nr:MAG: hypothetical protein BRC77_09770 [Halobacteriales archaeon QH_8_64_26]
MSSNANRLCARDDSEARPGPDTPDSVARTGTYEDDGVVVLYDSEAPLAWLQSTRTYRLADRR